MIAYYAYFFFIFYDYSVASIVCYFVYFDANIAPNIPDASLKPVHATYPIVHANGTIVYATTGAAAAAAAAYIKKFNYYKYYTFSSILPATMLSAKLG